ncbi:hypothetical protein Tco_0661029 [Tanacetum coccineum]
MRNFGRFDEDELEELILDGMLLLTVRNKDEEENTPANDRFSKADGFHAIPPPITGNFLTPRSDILFAGLDEYAIRKKIIESKTTNLNTKTSKTVGKTNEANTQKPKTVYESVNRDKVVIEDWNSDDEDDVSEVQIVKSVSTVRPFAPKIAQTGGAIRPIYLRMDNGNPEIMLQDHAVVDSSCSSHMTGNEAYLSDYKDINGGFVAFGSDPKGETFPNDPPLSRGYTLRSGEDSLELMELMANWKLCLDHNSANGLQSYFCNIDRHEKLITKDSLRRHLKLEDAEGIYSLSNKEIFDTLAHKGITSSPALYLKQPLKPSPLNSEPLQPTHEARETASNPIDSPLHEFTYMEV